MKFAAISALVTIGIVVCGTCQAAAKRSIIYDCGQYTPASTSSPPPAPFAPSGVAPDGFSLSILPGADSGGASGGSCSGFGADINNNPQYMAQGGLTGISSSSSIFTPDWEVFVTAPATGPTFTVEFLYSSAITTNDPGCLGETASLSLSTGSYSSKGACGGTGDYLFTFNSSTGALVSGGFQTSTPTSAPEIDANAASGGLTVLFGAIALIIGRRSRMLAH